MKQEFNLIFSNLIKRLNQTLTKFHLVNLVDALAVSLLIAILLFNLAIVIELVAEGSREFRTTLFFGLASLVAISILVLNFKPLLAFLKIKYNQTISDIAFKIGDKYPEIKDKLANAIDLFDNYINSQSSNNNNNNSNFGISKDLVLANLEYTHETTKSINFDEIISYDRTKKIIPIFIFSLFLTVVGNFNPAYNKSLERLLNYDKAYIPAAPFEIYNNNEKQVYVDKGKSVKLEFKSKGLAPNYINVIVESIEDNQTNSQDETEKNAQIYKVKLINKDTYKFELANIKEKYKVYAQAEWYDEKYNTTETKVLITEIPEITNLDGVVRFPPYTNQESLNLTIDNADIVALNGSKADIKIQTNFNITKARLIFEKRKDFDTFGGNVEKSSENEETDNNNQNSANDNNKNIKKVMEKAAEKLEDHLKTGAEFKGDYTIRPMTISGDKTAKVDFTIKESGSYWIEVENNQGHKNLYPVKYSVIATEDDYPSISLIEPQKDINVKDNLSVSIVSQIADDYGFKHLKLFYRLIESKYDQPNGIWEEINIPFDKKELNTTVYYLWNLKLVDITPEDKFEFYLEVADNDAFSGYKKSISKTLTVRMISFEETMEIAEKNTEKIQKQIEEAVKKSEEVKKEMQELRKDLINAKNQNELTWEQKKKAEAIAKKQQEIQKTLENAQKELEKSVDQMKENNLLSEETMQKYMELQELMKEVNSDELRKMSQKMQDMMKQMTPEQMQKALENAKFDEEMFKQSMERTKQYLEKLKIEQKADAVKKYAEELAKRQEELMKKADEAKNAQDNENIAKEQNDLKKDIDKLEKEMIELQKQVEKNEKIADDTFKEAQQEFNPEEMKENMENAKNDMKKNDKKSAKQNQKKAKEKLDKLADKMQKMKQELQNKMAKEIERQFNKSINDIVQLSKKQEQLNKKTQAMSSNSNNMNDAIKEQGDVTNAMRNALENTAKLAEQTMAIQSESIEDMLKAIQQMEKAQQELQDRRNSAGTKAQKDAMSAMNSAAKSLQAALKDMKQGGDGACDNPGGSGEGSSGGGGGQGMPMGGGMSQQMQQMMQQQKMIQEAMQKMMQQGQQQGQGQGQSGTQNGKGKSPSQMTAQEKAEYGRLQGEQGKALKSMEELAKEQEKFKSKDPVKNEQMRKAMEEMKEVISDIQSGKVDENTMKKQDRILSKMLEISRSENERDKENKRESNEGKDYMQKFNGSLESEEDKERVLQELLKSLKFGYSKDYEKVIKRYMENIKNLQIGN